MDRLETVLNRTAAALEQTARLADRHAARHAAAGKADSAAAERRAAGQAREAAQRARDNAAKRARLVANGFGGPPIGP